MPTIMRDNSYESKRFQRSISPLTGLNGKLAQSTVKCVHGDVAYTGIQFAYGYSKFGSPKTLFAIRAKSRTSAYSAAETANKNYFTSAVATADATLADVDARAAALAEYKANTHGYKTLRTYLIAKAMFNHA